VANERGKQVYGEIAAFWGLWWAHDAMVPAL
jgi:hypothetical protein